MTPIAHSSHTPMMRVVPHRVNKFDVAINISGNVFAGFIVIALTTIIALTLTLLAGVPGYLAGGLFLGIGHSNITLLLGKIALFVGISSSGLTFLLTGAIALAIYGIVTSWVVEESAKEISPPTPNANDAPNVNMNRLRELYRELTRANQ